MTITDTAIKYRYEGNAVTDTFAFSGKAFTAGDLVVETITRATDVLVETLTLTTHYSVTIAAAGTASITVVAGKIPSALQDIQIRRSLAQTQTVSLPSGTKFPASSIESAIDRAVGLVQDLDEVVTRAVKFPVTSSTTVATLPEPVDDTVLCFDGTTGLFKVGATNTVLAAGATAAAASAVEAASSASSASTSVTLASQWATLTSGQVATTDYSAKAYAIGGTGVTNAAGAAKEWAAKAEDSTVDGSLFSALHYSAKASDSADAAAASAAAVNMPSITATDTGSILQVNAAGTAYQLLAPGTAGKVLTSNGADALMTMETPASGAVVLLSTQTASSSASISFSSTYITSTYKSYIIRLSNVIPATDSAELYFTASIDNGSNYLAGTSYLYHFTSVTAAAATYSGFNSTGAAQISLNSGMGTGTGENYAASILLDNPSNATVYKNVIVQSSYYDYTPDLLGSNGQGLIKTTSAVNNVKFACSTGNIASGTFKLYGVL